MHWNKKESVGEKALVGQQLKSFFFIKRSSACINSGTTHTHILKIYIHMSLSSVYVVSKVLSLHIMQEQLADAAVSTCAVFLTSERPSTSVGSCGHTCLIVSMW